MCILAMYAQRGVYRRANFERQRIYDTMRRNQEKGIVPRFIQEIVAMLYQPYAKAICGG